MTHHLGFGQFFGSRAREYRGDGFTVALMRPDPVREVELHVHDAAHLIIHLEGAYLSTAAGAPPACRHPLVVVNPPGTTHRDRYAREEGAFRGRFVSVGIETAQWRAWCEHDHIDAWSTSNAGVMRAAGRVVQQLGEGNCTAMESAVVELVAQTSANRDVPRRHPPAWLRRAMELLRDRCAAEVRVSDVAVACGVHPVSLARAFRRHLGMSPGDLLRAARLERAVALLACSNQSIASIAHACGYAHQSHLTRHLRQVHGVTPAVYRLGCRS